MPGRTLPTFTVSEVESHNTAKSCYVTVGRNVYDVSDFLDSHPGGSELILEYAGKDVADILKDEASHSHSETAYDVLDESLVGFLASGKASNGSAPNGKAANGHAGSAGNDTAHPRTGMSCEEDLSKETDFDRDYRTHKFLDLGRPLFPQIWFGGFSKEFYLDQVHRPRHYKGGESAPLFGNILEPLSKTPWWLIPVAWLPPVGYGLYLARQGLNSSLEETGYFLFGLGLWTLIEYGLHRCLFHLD